MMKEIYSEILIALKRNKYISQHELALLTGQNLENLNKGLISLIENGYLNKNYELTEKAEKYLRENNYDSKKLSTNAIDIIKKALVVNDDEINDICVCKNGMTNSSFVFNYRGDRYMIRIPGEGTDELVNRLQEEKVYELIRKYKICDDIVYINGKNGYKITKYIENSRNCDINNENDLKKCMKKLKEFHNLKLKVEHEFDVYKELEKYEKLWTGKNSIHKDYIQTKNNIYKLKKYIEDNSDEKVLCHIDANYDNFLITDTEIRLIDWEYAGMQDPDIDIAMFGIYAMYEKKEMDKIIDIYYENRCPEKNRIKIYCYCAICGLLWSNWCEYKRSFGVEFGEYFIRQYKYAKEYYEYVIEKLKKIGYCGA